MNFKQQTLAALASTSATLLPNTLSVAGPGVELRCDLVALDTLACAFDQLTVHVAALAGHDIDRLKKAGQQLAARLTYLLEAIATIEVDSQSCTVLLRSQQPQKEADSTSYYELLVKKGGDLLFGRYTKPTGDLPRHRIPSQLTREVFGRLADDFASVQ